MSKTIFIIGAGSSIEFRFPSGRELLESILRDTYLHKTVLKVSDDAILETLAYFLTMNLKFSNKEVMEFQRRLNLSYSESIDQFIHHTKDERIRAVGIASISRTISYCEEFHKRAILNDSNRGARPQFGWIGRVWNLYLNRTPPFDKMTDVKFITFNYDRSFEYSLSFLINSLYPDSSFEERKHIYNQFEIEHVYGKIGPTDFESIADDYGRRLDADRIVNVLSDISLIRDNYQPVNLGQNTLKALRDFETCYFLGFGMNRMNLNLLFGDKIQENITKQGLNKMDMKKRNFYGTRLGLNAPQMMTLSEFSRDIDYLSPNFHEVTCTEFMNDMFYHSPS